MLILRNRPIFDGLDFPWVDFDPVLADDVSKELALLLGKSTLVNASEELFLSEDVQDNSNMSTMLFLCFTIDENII
jgi:hypothetical protein